MLHGGAVSSGNFGVPGCGKRAGQSAGRAMSPVRWGWRKSFGGVQAVEGRVVQLAAGELLALIGPNGAASPPPSTWWTGSSCRCRGSIRWTGQDWSAATRHLAHGRGRTFQIAQTGCQLHRAAERADGAAVATTGAAWRWWRRAPTHRPQDALALLEQVGMAAQAGPAARWPMATSSAWSSIWRWPTPARCC